MKILHILIKRIFWIYNPKGGKNYPVIIYFRGGGLLSGSKELGKDIGEK